MYGKYNILIDVVFEGFILFDIVKLYSFYNNINSNDENIKYLKRYLIEL